VPLIAIPPKNNPPNKIKGEGRYPVKHSND
jgi:hypothetical protein